MIFHLQSTAHIEFLASLVPSAPALRPHQPQWMLPCHKLDCWELRAEKPPAACVVLGDMSFKAPSSAKAYWATSKFWETTHRFRSTNWWLFMCMNPMIYTVLTVRGYGWTKSRPTIEFSQCLSSQDLSHIPCCPNRPPACSATS